MRLSLILSQAFNFFKFRVRIQEFLLSQHSTGW